MADLALLGGLVGAGAGFFFGGPAGAGLGYSAGSSLGGVAGGGSAGFGASGGGTASSATSSRHLRINPTRVSGNLFAQACAQFGVGSAQCPRSELDRWATVTRSRYPTAYREIIEPLQRSGQSNIGLAQLRALNASYLTKRQGAPDFASYAPLLRAGSATSGSGGGYRLRLWLGLRL